MTTPRNKSFIANMSSEQAFSLGQMVEWTSQAGGKERTKIGVVVGVLHAHMPLRLLPYYETMRINAWSGSSRDHKSYIVAEIHPHRKSKFCWPRVQYLKKAARYLPVVLNRKHLALPKKD